MFVTSLKTIRENITYLEFEEALRSIKEANDRGKLDEFLGQVQRIYDEGTDLVSAFQHALFDVLSNPGENTQP